MKPFVEHADELSVDCLRSMLHLPVSSVVATEIGTGQIGSSWRLSLTYDGELGPATLVAKLGGGDREQRRRIATAYIKEVGFYRDLVVSLDVRAPTCWYSAIADDGANFTVLLDDLAPARPGVQVDGCSLDQAIGAVVNLATLHASRWNDITLSDYGFLAPVGAEHADFLRHVLVDATETFIERYQAGLAPSDQATLRESALAIAQWVAIRSEPFAVIHGDYRLENLMFPPQGNDVIALDWQSVSIGPPLRDVAYFVATTFDKDERRRVEDQLVTTYHDELLARGIADYGRDRCFQDYRIGQLQGPLITVLGAVHATATQTDHADAMFIAMASRSCAAIRDLETLALVATESGG